MATNQVTVETADPKTSKIPKTVKAAKLVDVVLVTYIDEKGQEVTQFGILGDKNVHLLDSKQLGASGKATPQGIAREWLSKAVLAMVRK